MEPLVLVSVAVVLGWSASLAGCEGQPTQPWAVYNMDHLQELLGSHLTSSGSTTRHGVLVSYRKSCPLEDALIKPTMLPSRHLMMYMEYDLDFYPGLQWFRHLKHNDITQWVNSSACPHVLFLRAGAALGSDTQQWSSESSPLSFRFWAWKQVNRTVQVVNPTPHKVALVLSGEGPWPKEIEIQVLQPGETKEVTVFEGFRIAAHRQPEGKVETDRFLGAWVVSADTQVIEVVDQDIDQDFMPWLNGEVQADREESARVEAWQTEVAKRHLRILLQPPTLPNLSKTGYTTMDIPWQIYFPLLSFYRWSHESSLEQYKYCPGARSGFSPQKTRGIASHLMTLLIKWAQSVVERWSGRPATFVGSGGLEEFVKGMSVAPLVRSANISAILQVDEEEVTEGRRSRPWPLEVVDVVGFQGSVGVRPGMVVLLEAAKVMHGFPRALSKAKVTLITLDFSVH